MIRTFIRYGQDIHEAPLEEQCEIGIVPKTVFSEVSRWEHPRCLSERTGKTSGSPSSISATKKEATDEKGDNHIILMQKPIHSFHPGITQSRFPGRITEWTCNRVAGMMPYLCAVQRISYENRIDGSGGFRRCIKCQRKGASERSSGVEWPRNQASGQASVQEDAA